MDQQPGAAPTRAGAEAPRSRPPLRRDTEVGIVGGVAAGLARHLDVDVVLIRIGFVIGTLLTQGLGLLAYVLAWIFVPKADPAEVAAFGRDDAGGRRRDPAADDRGAAFWLGVGLLAVGVLWFLGAVGGLGPAPFGLVDAGILVPLLLIGLGIALWRTSDRSEPRAARASRAAPDAAPTDPPTRPSDPSETVMSTLPAPPAAPTQASGVRDPSSTGERAAVPSTPTSVAEEPGAERAGEGAGDETGGPPPPPPAAPDSGEAGFTPPPVPQRGRSLLTRLTLGAALMIVGVLWILDVTAVTALGPLMILAIALAVIGIGLLVGSVVGRGRALIVAGALLLPLVLAGVVLQGVPSGSLLDATLRGDAAVGDIRERPLTTADLDDRYRMGAGAFQLDLGALELEEDATTRIELGAGELIVTVPDDVHVEVVVRLGGGAVTLFDQERAGLGLELEVREPPVDPAPDDAPTLRLEIEAGFGDLHVRR